MSNPISKTIKPLNIFCGKEQRYLPYKEFYKIMQDHVYINKINDQFDETRKNYWTFELDNDPLQCKKENIKNFYTEIISARSNFIKTNYPNLKMVFYTWYEQWQFRLSLTQIHWGKLPFECDVKKVESLDDVIQDFIDDPYKFGIIPFENLTEVTDNDNDEEFLKNRSINVWSIVSP
jgi:hypothetical protein